MNLIPTRERNGLPLFRSELDNLFNRYGENDWADANLPAVFRRTSVPPINVAETDKNFSVSMELPGLNEKDIQVQVMGQQLVISGERKWEEEKKNKEFHRVESQYGSFQRAVALPENLRLDPASISATYKKGILDVTFPKVEPTPAAKIPVKAS